MTELDAKIMGTAESGQSTEAEDVLSFELLELVYRLLDKWKTIVSVTLICMLLAGLYTSFLATPIYEATSTIYVLNRGDSAINFSDLQLGTALTKDYIKAFNMWEVHEEVISNLNLSYSYREMENMLSLTNTSDTRMIDITISSPNPAEAAMIANEYAKVGSQYIAETMVTDKPSIMSVALVPSNPVSPSMVKNLIVGFLLGMLLSCGYEIARFLLDDKYKSPEDIRRFTGMATLAIIPKVSASKARSNSRRYV